MLGKCIGALISLLLCLAFVQAHAGQQAGLDWLHSELSADGHFENQNGTATDFQAASTALLALHVLDPTDDAALGTTLGYIDAETYRSTENLARTIIARRSLNRDVSALVAELAALQNPDGGFGELDGYDSTVLDTAWALDALAAAGQANRAISGPAIQYLLNRQKTGGNWNDNAGLPSLYVSAIATQAIWRYRHTYKVATALDKGVQYVLAQRGADGLWPEPFLSALALIAAAPAAANTADIQTSWNALAALQLPDGSWSDDVFVTALSLRALQAAQQGNPDLGSIRGQVVDGDYGYPVAGVEVQINGPTSRTGETGRQGYFEFGNLLPGDYTIHLTSPDYPPLQVATFLSPGASKDFGTIRLLESADSTTARVTGTVTAAASGAPVAGANVRVLNTSMSATTDPGGQYILAGIAPGDAVIEASKAGYQDSRTVVHVDTNETLLLSPVLTAPASSTFSITGTVTDGTTGGALSGASVTVTGDASATAQTDASGTYRISGLNPGAVTVSIAHAGYQGAQASFSAGNGAEFSFSPGLYPDGVTPPDNQGGGLAGTLVDQEMGLPLSGVTITAMAGGQSVSTTSASDGAFQLGNLPVGDGSIKFERANYDTRQLSVPIRDRVTVDIGEVKLRPVGYTEGATAVGIVLDSITNDPLAGVSIKATINGKSQALTSEGDGHFSIKTVAETDGALIFNADGYRKSRFPVYLQPGVNDLAQIRLRSEGVDNAKPDLKAKNIDASSAHTSPSSLMLSGRVVVDAANIGNTSAGDFDAVAFYDVDHDGAYDPGKDALLGKTSLHKQINPGESANLDIPVAGKLPFRDAPISVWLDSGQTIVEQSEKNNISTTADFCKVLPVPAGQLDPELKWSWNGSSHYPGVNNVLGPVTVGELNDDNEDGAINGKDTPDLVFVAGNRIHSSSSTVLYALSGDTGKPLWSNGGLSLAHRGSTAMADIDGDGVVEIVVVGQHRKKLYAFANDGTLKWQALDGPHYTHEGVSDGLTIADLDHDGTPEIIDGNRVFNADGSLRWVGQGDAGGTSNYPGGFRNWGFDSIAADVDRGGNMEVVAGRTLYDSDGHIIWSRTDLPYDGFNAVGNFDADGRAEIVLVAYGTVYLLDDTGKTLWKVAIPGGGRGGPPTVADFDNDGKPEIGVAAARHYVVFDTDGSILWTSDTHDHSSNMTGSSLFDFDADGKAEVLYSDERNFHIYNGETGETLYKIHNTSITTLEYPNVADVDGDGHADIIVTGNRYGGNATPGVRVYQAAKGEWAPTRAIWNEHAYHITNINDDGTVPVREKPSWLSHNTYRLNTFADRNPLQVPDLSVSLLHVVDNGNGQPRSLTARIGNGGAVAVSKGTQVTFYAGDPEQGGTSLGSVKLDKLAPGAYRDVRLNDVPALSSAAVFAVVDPDNKVDECDETNNAMSVSATTPAMRLGDVSITTDHPRYGFATTVHLTASVTNTGSFAGQYQVDLRIEDQSDALVANLGSQALGSLAPGAKTNATADWPTGGVLAGTYRARAVLSTADGTQLDQAVSVFEVAPSTGSGPVARLSTTTDHHTYNVTDTAKLNNLVRNLSTNALLRGTAVNLQVLDPNGDPVFETSRQLGDLPASGDRKTNFAYSFTNAPKGTYHVSASLVDNSAMLLATDTAQYDVAIQLGSAVAGDVTAHPAESYLGGGVVCIDTLTNRTSYALPGLELRQTAASLAAGTAISRTRKTLSLAPNANRTLVRNVPTATLTPGDYACALELKIAGQWQPLADATFHLKVPPIKMDSTLAQSGHGRLLVLLDAPERGKQGQITDDNDPYGPAQPGLSAQRDWLENALATAGWSYTIVTSAQAFQREFNTGGYEVYAILSEAVKLPERLIKRLDQAVNDGSGLAVAGNHDRRNNHIEDVLGLHSTGKNLDGAGLTLDPSDLDQNGGQATFPVPAQPLSVKNRGADVVGHLLLNNGRTAPAVFTHTYGKGKTTYLALDLALEGTATGGDNLFARLLTDSLDYVHPAQLVPRPGRVLPIELQIHNEGVATPGRAVITLPAGASVSDPHSGTVQSNGKLVWQFNLDQDEILKWPFWLRLPDQPGTVTVSTQVQSGSDPDYVDQTSSSVQIHVQPKPTDNQGNRTKHGKGNKHGKGHP